MLIYNWKPWFTLKDTVMDPSYDGPDMTYFFDQNDEPSSNRLNKFSMSEGASLSFEGRVHGWADDAGWRAP